MKFPRRISLSRRRRRSDRRLRHGVASGRGGRRLLLGPRRIPQAAERPQGRPLPRHDVAQGGHRRLLQHRLPDRAQGSHRLRPPLRAHDVPGLAEPRQDGVHQARPVERRHPQRLDALRLHQLLRDRALERARDGALGRGRPHEGPRDHERQPEEPAGSRQERGEGQRPEPPLRRLPLARPAAVREHELVQRAQLLRRPEGPRRRDARGRQAFFTTYYSPNNAALVVVGDFDPKQANAWIDKYFAPIPAAKLPPKPDISEPRQEKEKRASKPDALATRPALAVGYHVPKRNTPEYYAMGLLDQILVQGKDSRLYQALVQKAGLTGDVEGGINLGPRQHVQHRRPDALGRLALPRQGQVVRADPQGLRRGDREASGRRRWTRPTIDRAMVKVRSDLYDNMEGLFGFGRADLLASYALFDDDPSAINRIEANFLKVTPELLQKTAQEYLRSGEPDDSRHRAEGGREEGRRQERLVGARET